MPAKSVIDPISGKEFKSITEMCEEHGISLSIYLSRLRLGWTQEQALITPARSIIDPISGKEFKSVREMCVEHGIDLKVYQGRLKLGWTQEQALTTPVKNVIDPISGKEFNTLAEMCIEHGINLTTYFSRLKRGWTQEQALTTPVKNVIDPISGKKFKSIGEMCIEHSIDPRLYTSRLKLGWTQEQALTTPVKEVIKSIKFFKIFGKSFSSWNEAVLEFRVIDLTFTGTMDRIRRRHWDMEISIVVTKKDARDTNLILLDITNRAWYKVPWSQDLKTARDIIEHYRPDLLEQYDKAHPNGEYNPYVEYEEDAE